MNHFSRFARHFAAIAFSTLFLPGALTLTIFIILREVLGYELAGALAFSTVLYICLVLLSYAAIKSLALKPIEKLWQAVWHISPGSQRVPAPKLEDLMLGREMISGLVRQVYDLASSSPIIKNPDGEPLPVPTSDTLLNHLPIGLMILDKNRLITHINPLVPELLGIPADKILNHAVYDVLHLSFQTDDTLDSWLNEVTGHVATSVKSWERIRVSIDDPKSQKQIDMAASYSKDNSEGHELILALFDHTKSYDRQDSSYGYVALAVHELRTPLTVLRGYIEVFDDELGGQMTPELREFMRKMDAAAETLTAFVSNILNVARVEENQLVLSLHEADWNVVLPEILKDLELRASVRGKMIELDLQPDLPKVAIDKISMYEVVSNLVDNAVKYSGQSPKIIVHTKLAQDGTIETIVQDFGVGMPESSLGELFTKFYRSHRSKNAVSGSGLGLYLVKAIVNAHGGNVWVNSKEGEGSSFGFSLQPFTAMANENKNTYGIERQASGWIKNHSFYRR